MSRGSESASSIQPVDDKISKLQVERCTYTSLLSCHFSSLVPPPGEFCHPGINGFSPCNHVPGHNASLMPSVNRQLASTHVSFTKYLLPRVVFWSVMLKTLKTTIQPEEIVTRLFRWSRYMQPCSRHSLQIRFTAFSPRMMLWLRESLSHRPSSFDWEPQLEQTTQPQYRQ